MPLTQAHPAAAVPFRRLGLPLSALVIGSMMPDSMKYLTLRPGNDFGHSWSGILWFCVPTGLLALALFHILLKHPLLALLPKAHQQRLSSHLHFSFFPFPQFALIVAGLIVGAATHMVWDSFTHQSGLAVRQIPPLSGAAFTVGRHSVKFYSILQHTSTLTGITLLLLWYVRWLRATPANGDSLRFNFSPKVKLLLWLGLICMAALPAVGYGFLKARQLTHLSAIKVFAGRTIVATTVIFCGELFLYSLLWRFVAPLQVSNGGTPPAEFRPR